MVTYLFYGPVDTTLSHESTFYPIISSSLYDTLHILIINILFFLLRIIEKF